ncbi:hypothetical protein ACVRZS_03740 [Streptococcus ferus]|uniref:Integral membrane protein n=1 Tax=Streptococcus ferus TaxID=1345 RepID=A0A2X3W3I5_9STRE|nr:hypothetical protein [Streptococcus ferus]SQF40177.1 Uncharacterised protein [Streptococcus ferus]
MKKILTNIFATTGFSLILLAVIAVFFGVQWLLLITLFQVLLANVLIHLSLFIRQKWELQSVFLAAVTDIVIINGIVFLLSAVFSWNVGNWVLLLIGLMVYLISCLLDLFYLNQEAHEINLLIRRRHR